LAINQIIGNKERSVLGPFLLQLLWQLLPRPFGGLELEELVTVEAGQGAVDDVVAAASDEDHCFPK